MSGTLYSEIRGSKTYLKLFVTICCNLVIHLRFEGTRVRDISDRYTGVLQAEYWTTIRLINAIAMKTAVSLL